MKKRPDRQPLLLSKKLQRKPYSIALILAIGLFADAIYPKASHAIEPRFGLQLGYGEAAVTKNSIIRNESPGAFGFYFEYPLSSVFSIAAEYKRTLGFSPTFSSSVSMTGVAFKYFFFVPYPQREATQEEGEKSFFVQKNISPYAAASLGYAQATIPSKLDTLTAVELPESNAVAVYLSLKGGVEYPLFGRVGVTGELSFSTSVIGDASFEFFQMLFGVYLHL